MVEAWVHHIKFRLCRVEGRERDTEVFVLDPTWGISSLGRNISVKGYM
jgi:hypothetical protein